MSRVIGRLFLTKLLIVGWMVVVACPLWLARWWLQGHEKVNSTVGWVMVPMGLVCLLASLWLGKTTAHYMVDENQMFLDAIKRTLWDARLRMAFVPVVGWWFIPGEDKTKPDGD